MPPGPAWPRSCLAQVLLGALEPNDDETVFKSMCASRPDIQAHLAAKTACQGLISLSAFLHDTVS